MTPTTTAGGQAVYWYDSKDKTENLSFCIRCDATISSTQHFDIQSDRGNFKFIVTESSGNYRFFFNTASSDFTLLQKYKRCNLKQPQSKTWNQYNLGYLFFGKYYIAAEISRAQLQTVEEQHEFEFRLIGCSSAIALSPAADEPIYTDVLMDRYHRDKASYDVFFNCGDESSDGDVKSLSDSEDLSGGKDPSDIDHEKNTADSVKEAMLGAHRFVVSQWPYFKTMLESGFKEGGSGAKKVIRIMGVKPKTFQLMLQFMYMGTLPPTSAALYEDEDVSADQASWEGLYIAADRYRIDDLRKLAVATIESKLDSAAAIDFLFRSAYLYAELRRPVVKYISKEHSAEISKREIRDAYKAHAEFSELLGELYDAFHKLVARKGCSCSRFATSLRRS